MIGLSTHVCKDQGVDDGGSPSLLARGEQLLVEDPGHLYVARI